MRQAVEQTQPDSRVKVQISRPLTKEAAARVLKDLICFLLYARRQIPCMFEDLQKATQVSQVPVEFTHESFT